MESGNTQQSLKQLASPPGLGSKKISQFPSTKGLTPSNLMDANNVSRQTTPATINLTMFHRPSGSKRNSTMVQELTPKVMSEKSIAGSRGGSRRILATPKEPRRSVVLAGSTEKLSAIQQKILYGTFEYDHDFNGMFLVTHINSRNYRIVIENAKLKFERSKKQAGPILNTGIGDFKRGQSKVRRKKSPRK